MGAVYGSGFDSSMHAQRLVQKVEQMNRGSSRAEASITMESFAQFAQANPALLFPAFEMQNKIQRKILGTKFWESHLNRRISLTKGGENYVSVKQILDMKVNKVQRVE